MRDQSVRLERLLLSNHKMQSDAKSVIKMKNDMIWDKNKGIRANDWRYYVVAGDCLHYWQLSVNLS